MWAAKDIPFLTSTKIEYIIQQIKSRLGLNDILASRTQQYYFFMNLSLLPIFCLH